MLKTFFWLCRSGKSINAQALLNSPKAYMQYHGMCHSKLCGNNTRKAKLPKVLTAADVKNYLERSRWIYNYWIGNQQSLGGPDPRDCGGYKRPTGTGADLKEYGGKVRLVPS